MKNYLKTLSVLSLLSLMLSSCLGGDDNSTSTVGYDDMAITAITLGTLNRYTHTTSSTTGNDTIIKSGLTGSAYNMTIDQLSCRIFNHDLLPVGTDLKHVLLSSISTKNNAIATLKSKTSDSIMVISSSDSIDFSTPRILRVYCSNLDKWRDYTMTLTANPNTGINFEWRKVSTIEEVANEDWTGKHLVTFNDSVRLVDHDVVVMSDMLLTGSLHNDVAYRLNGNNIEYSTDLDNWTTVETDGQQPELRHLLGTGTKELFALGLDSGIKHSSDNGMTWQDEPLDDDATLLPVKNMAMTAWKYTPVDSTDYVLMVGNDSNDSIQVWRKISQYGGPTKGGQWVYMEGVSGLEDLQRINGSEGEQLPSLVFYQDAVLALGSNNTVYESYDQGLSWAQSTTYAFPKSLTGERVMIGVAKDMLWLVTNSGEIWQGTKR